MRMPCLVGVSMCLEKSAKNRVFQVVPPRVPRLTDRILSACLRAMCSPARGPKVILSASPSRGRSLR